MFFRSLLFVPGTRTDRIEKAIASEADAVIIDLEDAVELSEKEAVRDRVAGFLEKKQAKKIFVRVNGVETEYFDQDMEKIVLPQVCGLLIPKTEKPEDMRKIDQRITDLEKKKAIPAGQIRLICQIETALGLHQATEIASSTPRVLALAFGAADLTLDLGAVLSKTGEELFFVRSWLVLASRLAGVYPIDSPYMVDFKDVEGLSREARLSRQLGFRGKLCIHPIQLGPIHEVFSPSQDEVNKAKRVVEAFEQAKQRGESAISLDGQFIDPPIYGRAKQILEFAKAIGMS
jgi:citrate lyase subunit beta/citryl-CoA lyase